MRDTIQDEKFFENRIKDKKNEIRESNKYLNMGKEKGDEKIIKMSYENLYKKFKGGLFHGKIKRQFNF